LGGIQGAMMTLKWNVKIYWWGLQKLK